MGMVQYAKYGDTGEILGMGICSEANLKHKEILGLKVVRGIADDRLHRIVDGKIVDKSPEDIEFILPPAEDRVVARIFQEDWDALVKRIEALEKA